MTKSTIRVIWKFKDIKGLQQTTYQNVYLIDYSDKGNVIICMNDDINGYSTATFDLKTLIEIQLF